MHQLSVLQHSEKFTCIAESIYESSKDVNPGTFCIGDCDSINSKRIGMCLRTCTKYYSSKKNGILVQTVTKIVTKQMNYQLPIVYYNLEKNSHWNFEHFGKKLQFCDIFIMV